MEPNKIKIRIVISGPQGSGKSTIKCALLALTDGFGIGNCSVREVQTVEPPKRARPKGGKLPERWP